MPILSGRHARATRWAVALLIASAGSGAHDRTARAQAQPAAQSPTAVIVVPVARKAKTPSLTFTGRVEAVDKIELRTRAEGYLQKRLFTEGQTVKEGDLLFEVDQAPYQAKLDAARANVARAEANAVNAAVQLRRGLELLKNNNIPASTVDERAAADAEAKAEVLQQKAAVRTAEIDLSYTQLFAPVTGQIGRATYSIGNYVGPSSGSLATLVSRDPMYATFPVTQRELLTLRKRAEEEHLDRSALRVRLQLADGSTYSAPGTLDFLDVQVSAQTDTVTTRAKFPNPEQFLIDGQLVTVVVELGTSQTALYIPQQAVQFDQTGYSVLVVDKENRVKVRRVTLGVGQETDIEIASGLEAGERVITEGIQKVRSLSSSRSS
jgi:membrane fusion protein (multidrug efflux system)